MELAQSLAGVLAPPHHFTRYNLQPLTPSAPGAPLAITCRVALLHRRQAAMGPRAAIVNRFVSDSQIATWADSSSSQIPDDDVLGLEGLDPFSCLPCIWFLDPGAVHVPSYVLVRL